MQELANRIELPESQVKVRIIALKVIDSALIGTHAYIVLIYGLSFCITVVGKHTFSGWDRKVTK